MKNGARQAILWTVITTLVIITSCGTGNKRAVPGDERIDLFVHPAALGKMIAKDTLAYLTPDSAFRTCSCVLVATIQLADSVTKDTRNNAGSYLYKGIVKNIWKNTAHKIAQDVYFFTAHKLAATDTAGLLLFLVPLSNHTLLLKDGKNYWQCLPGAPVTVMDSTLFRHWQQLHYIAATPHARKHLKKKHH